MYVTLSIEGGTHPDLAVRSHRFDETGGSVGRDPGADWVLPDKRNVVSGRHMRVAFASGRFSVVDTSRNGTYLNGRPVGANQSQTLSDGDRLRIGDYEFVARLGDAPAWHAAGTPGSVSLVGLHESLVETERPSARDTDPLAHIAPAAPRADRFSAATAPRASSGGRFGADDDLAGLFDDTPGQPDTAALIDPTPFLAPVAATIIPLPVPVPVPPGPPPPVLPEAAAPVPLHEVPPSLAPSLAPSLPPSLPPSLAPAAPAPLVPDDWSPDFGALSTPRTGAAPIDLASFSLQPPPPAPIPLRPVPPVPETAAAPVQDAALLLQRREAARNAPAPGAPGATPGATPAATPGAGAAGDEAELLALLWKSLGVDPGRLSAKDKQRFVGELGLAMREMSEGLIGVLGMRQNIKSEFRMERTMVGSTENNLFKFTRNADELLALAVSNANKVFLPLDRAVRGAFNDIKAHELSTLAAVQLSIRSLLDRFNPAKIEKQVQEKRKGFSFGSLKASCWEHFSEDYGNLAGDADEASNRIFATELARAYRERTQKQPDA